MRDIWILLSKHFPVVSSMIAPFHAHPWIAGLIVVLIGIVLYFAPVGQGPKTIKSETAARKPQVSMAGWGAPKEASYPVSMLRGFYLFNHGETALEITVERFSLGSHFAYGETLAEIAAEKEGFSPILIEGKGPFFKHALDRTLEQEVDNRINKAELAYLQPLRIPVSVVYRDFENTWYRTSCDLIYRKGQIAFSAAEQTVLAAKPAKI